MAKEKIARSGEYIIHQTEEGSIITAKIYDNVKGALREVSEKIGFKFDPEWTTRQFGSKLIDELGCRETATGKIASSGEYVIIKKDDGAIKIYRFYDNVKGALREIAESIGFEYDKTWTTRQFGSKLIDELNK